MTTLDRRTLFHGAVATGSVALTAPAAVGATVDPLRRRAQAARTAWATAAADAEALLFVDRLETEHPQARHQVRRMASGLGAFHAVRDLLELEVEDQVHPDVQATLLDALQAIGELGDTGASVMEDYCTTHGATEQGEEELRMAIRAMRLGVKDWKTTLGRQKQVDLVLHDLAADARPGRLLARVRRQVRRVRRLRTMATDMLAEPDATGLLTPSDPQVIDAVRRGVRRYAAPRRAVSGDEGHVITSAQPKSVTPLTPEQRAAAVGLGLLSVVGYLVGIGLVCGAACAEVAFLPLALLGVAVIGLAVWGMQQLDPGAVTNREVRAGINAATDRIARELRPHAPGTLKVTASRALPTIWLHPRSMQFGRSPGLKPGSHARRMFVTCAGITRKWGQGAANANGTATTAGPDAPLPGAPERCLLVSIGRRLHRLGTTGELYVPAGARVEFHLNTPQAELGHLMGKLIIRVHRYSVRARHGPDPVLPPELQWTS